MTRIRARRRTGLAGVALAVVLTILGTFAWTDARYPLPASAQETGCWNTVWGTDDDGYFFTILAGDDCPEYRGRVFAGAAQRGPTVAAVGGTAKMTGVDACAYDAVEVKAVEAGSEGVLYRFKWSAEQLGCDRPPPAPPPTAPPGTAVPGPAGYVPFPGASVELTSFTDGCGLTVSGVGSSTHDLLLNGIQELTNGTVAARPGFSFWIAPEGGDRWTEGAFLAGLITDDCTVNVVRTLEDPDPVDRPAAEPGEPPGDEVPVTRVALEVGSATVIVERCGAEDGDLLVCIHDEGNGWINVDSVDGFGSFERLDGNTVVYRAEGEELRIRLRTTDLSEPVAVAVTFG